MVTDCDNTGYGTPENLLYIWLHGCKFMQILLIPAFTHSYPLTKWVISVGFIGINI